MDEEIKFVGQVLDNVHGFIPYTAAEKKIMETQLFKRLQSIKQLSVVNWVFPGSEHTRFIHSLGVMHIADKMAISLGLTTKDGKSFVWQACYTILGITLCHMFARPHIISQ